jgi:hypothetical protein
MTNLEGEHLRDPADFVRECLVTDHRPERITRKKRTFSGRIKGAEKINYSSWKAQLLPAHLDDPPTPSRVRFEFFLMRGRCDRRK